MNTTTTTTTTDTTTTTITDAASLAVVEKQAVDRLNKSLSKSSLDDFLNAGRQSLLLVDCSSSMSAYIRTGGTRIAKLRQVVDDLREQGPVPVAEFSGRGVRVVDSVPAPQGGTPLADAIEFGHREGANHLVVVTDGCPNSETAAFDAARRFANVIDVFYIGDGNDRGARFAEELAKMTGGTAHLTDLCDGKKLTAGIRALIGDGSF
jgi:Mg-chelatase subunit ChlD